MDENLITLPTQEETDRIRGYKITKWGQYDNYECLDCQYATLWPQKMEAHILEGDHPWAFPGDKQVKPADEDFVSPEY